MARFTTLMVALLLTFVTAGCAGGFQPQSGSIYDSRSFKDFNYQAADRLLMKADKKVKKEVPMLVSTISDIDNVEQSSTLGRTISEQLSSYLAQKGYKIAEVKLRQGINVQSGGMSPENTGEFMLSRDVRNISSEHKAGVALTGTYSVGSTKILVNLRLVDVRTGNIITGHDYEIPKTADVAALIASDSKAPVYFTRNYAY